MVLDAARLAARDVFAAENRAVLWKMLGITVLLLIGVWFGLQGLFGAAFDLWLDRLIPDLPPWLAWLGFVTGLFLAIGLAVGLGLLVAPVSAIVAGLFLDDVAAAVEQQHYPADPPGKALALFPAIKNTALFLGVVVAGNLLAFVLLFVPGINIMAFFMVNAYLLGREFFEFAAMRHMPPDQARALRARNSSTVFMAGLIMAAVLAIPLVNLLTPIFGAAMMTHLCHGLSSRSGAGNASCSTRGGTRGGTRN